MVTSVAGQLKIKNKADLFFMFSCCSGTDVVSEGVFCVPLKLHAVLKVCSLAFYKLVSSKCRNTVKILQCIDLKSI